MTAVDVSIGSMYLLNCSGATVEAAHPARAKLVVAGQIAAVVQGHDGGGTQKKAAALPCPRHLRQRQLCVRHLPAQTDGRKADSLAVK